MSDNATKPLRFDLNKSFNYYGKHFGVHISDNGEYVKFNDYEALQKQLEKKKQEIIDVNDLAKKSKHELLKQLDDAKAKIAELNKIKAEEIFSVLRDKKYEENERAKLEAENTRLREALEFYAKMDVHSFKTDFILYHNYNPFITDCIVGTKACEALKQEGGK